jgi:hypothetical protein
MKQWVEFKNRKVNHAAALTRYPPTRLGTVRGNGLIVPAHAYLECRVNPHAC